MTYSTDYLTALTCAAGTARDYGYVQTARALDRMIVGEKQRLRLLKKEADLEGANPKLILGYVREDTSL
jgi:hypothetical protein